MIKRRMGDAEGAERFLEVISTDMNVIENFSYHKLCLFYKGEPSEQELIGDGEDTPSGASAAYGLANWYFYEGDLEKATQHLDALVATDSWAAFGFIAAEADLAAGQLE
jgi:thioredoxin-like negative regulator of GroEL